LSVLPTCTSRINLLIFVSIGSNLDKRL
jgi:hypothetical protein